MDEHTRSSRFIQGAIYLMDFFMLNVITCFLFSISAYSVYGPKEWGHRSFLLILNFAYIVSIYLYPSLLNQRTIQTQDIMRRVFRTIIALLFLILISLCYINQSLPNWRWCLLFFPVIFLSITFSRLTSRYAVQSIRRLGRNTRSIIFLGSTYSMKNLWRTLFSDPSYGYRLKGYFDDTPSENFSQKISYLGSIKDVLSFLNQKEVHIDELYYCLPSTSKDLLCELMDYCEKHFIRFFVVPDVQDYQCRQIKMKMKLMGDIPVLSRYEEPLSRLDNRIKKRFLDLSISIFFLVIFFPIILLIVSIIMKLTMPGPIFFKQKRTGFQGKTFTCYKFRSMKVNKEADKLQATKDDPRKTRWGEIMRRTNIDELPQFINVLLGNMSVVGPRPHMVSQTKSYSSLINKYMMRHFAKPGITGWAQVTGFRGETKELWQMEARVQADVWYIENWSFWLDVRIIYMTVRNVLRGDKQAY